MAEQRKFSLTQCAAEIARKPFPFEWDGRDWTLPHLYDTALDVLIDDTADLGALRAAVAGAFDEEQAAAWSEAKVVPAGAFFQLLDEWKGWEGTDVGESAASSTSSKSTGRPSKRTSRGSMGSGSPRRSRAKTVTVDLPANSSS